MCWDCLYIFFAHYFCFFNNSIFLHFIRFLCFSFYFVFDSNFYIYTYLVLNVGTIVLFLLHHKYSNDER